MHNNNEYQRGLHWCIVFNSKFKVGTQKHKQGEMMWDKKKGFSNTSLTSPASSSPICFPEPPPTPAVVILQQVARLPSSPPQKGTLPAYIEKRWRSSKARRWPNLRHRFYTLISVDIYGRCGHMRNREAVHSHCEIDIDATSTKDACDNHESWLVHKDMREVLHLCCQTSPENRLCNENVM